VSRNAAAYTCVFQPLVSLPTIFDTCRPRAEVLAGSIRDGKFMLDLSRVVNGTTAGPDAEEDA
jgi:hypothetical protein